MKKFALVGVLLLVLTLALAGCSQSSLNLKGTVLDPAEAQASTQETTSQAAKVPGASEVLDVLQNTLTQIYDEVSPSVVNIRVTKTIKVPRELRRFFHDFRNDQDRNGSKQDENDRGHLKEALQVEP